MRCYCASCPVVEGCCPGGATTGGSAVLGAMPVAAGGLASSRAVRVFSPPAKISARMMTMNTALAIHPHGVGVRILRSISAWRSISISILRSKSLGSIMATSHLISVERYPPGKGLSSVRGNRPRASFGEGSGRKRRARSRAFVLLAEDQLGLRDDCRELSIAAGDARLQHDRRVAAVQRHADRMRGVASGHRGKEVGLALDRRGAAAVGKAAACRHPAERIAQRHHYAAVQHAAARAEIPSPRAPARAQLIRVGPPAFGPAQIASCDPVPLVKPRGMAIWALEGAYVRPLRRQPLPCP